MQARPKAQAESFNRRTPPTPAFSLLELVRIVYITSSGLLNQTCLQGELARIEWTEEKNRLLRMLLALLICLAFLVCALLCTSALVLTLAWDSEYRMLTLLSLIGVHIAGLVLAGWWFHALSARSADAFAATREELAADIALFGSPI